MTASAKRKYERELKKGKTHSEIAVIFGVTRQAVHDALGPSGAGPGRKTSTGRGRTAGGLVISLSVSKLEHAYIYERAERAGFKTPQEWIRDTVLRELEGRREKG